MKISFFGLLLLPLIGLSQKNQFYSIQFDPIVIPEFMGVQSFAVGRSGDELLLIGGRLDGLHRRQPWASFDSAGHNNQLIVLNLVTKQQWKKTVADLPDDLADQLKATNHCATQVGDSLYLVGGYGISRSKNDHITFPSAVALSVSATIQAIKNQHVSEQLFQVIQHDNFAVTGGQLQTIGKTFYLVGGHRFDGRYNPQNGPSFVQTYTNQIRQFTWNNQPIFTIITNEELLHKRDYNLVKVYDQFGAASFLACSGVFQVDVDLPHQSATAIFPSGQVAQVPNFRQFLNQYECPDVNLFDTITKTNHVLFFGGIAQFYDSLGVLVQDDDVPFTQHISVVEYNNGNASEFLHPANMPQLFGAGTAFVPLQEHVEWSASSLDSPIKLGYLVGGIQSSAKNIFWINEGQESAAVPTIYAVSLLPNKVAIQPTDTTQQLNVDLLNVGKDDRFRLFFDLNEAATVTVHYYNESGELIHNKTRFCQTGTTAWKTLLPKEKGMYRVKITVTSTERQQLSVWDQFLKVN